MLPAIQKNSENEILLNHVVDGCSCGPWRSRGGMEPKRGKKENRMKKQAKRKKKKNGWVFR